MSNRVLVTILATTALFGCDAPRQADNPNTAPTPPSWAAATSQDQFGTYADLKLGDLTQRFRWCPPGRFEMSGTIPGIGTAVPKKKGGKSHLVTLSHGFWLADAETNQAWFLAVTGHAVGSKHGPDYPIDYMTPSMADRYCEALAAKLDGIKIRLPTEAEWEYACKAGGSHEQVGNTATFAWCRLNSAGEIHPVKQLAPNAWGLYDMHGNVCEICSDYLAEFSGEDEADPKKTERTNYRVAKGGGATSGERDCMAIQRHKCPSASGTMPFGFRMAIDP